MYAKGGATQKCKKNYNLQCEFYKIRRHTKDQCWEIIGYPADYKFKRKNEGPNAACNSLIENKAATTLGAQYTQPYSQFQYGQNTYVGS